MGFYPTPSTKVEVPIPNNLRNFVVNDEQFKAQEIFPMYEDKKYRNSQIFAILFPKLKLLLILGVKKWLEPIANV